MRRLFAAISILVILSGCTSAAPVVPTPTNPPRPTVTPLPKVVAPAPVLVVTREIEVTRLVPVTSTPQPTSTNTPIPTPTSLPAATLLPSPIPTPDYTGPWSSINSMTVPRGWHSATVLRDGRVLIAGGLTALDTDLASVEIFDPATNTFSPAGSLHTARHQHSATLLPDGMVLIIAGYHNGWLSSAEIYDPVTNQWSITQPIFPHGVNHTATLLKDGRVLVMGGAIQSGSSGPDDRVEIFDPTTNRWQKAARHENTDAGAAATLLADGRVLIAGGSAAPAIYDPVNDTWQVAGNLVVARSLAQAVPLPDSRVLLTGGFPEPNGEMPLNSVEVYDPASNTWQLAAPMTQARLLHTAALLPDGRVLVIGGWKFMTGYETALLNTAEVYDPRSGTWSAIAPLSNGRIEHTTTLLPDGRILVTGGETSRGVYLDSAEILRR